MKASFKLTSFLLLMMMCVVACGAQNIKRHRMPSAVVNDYFEYTFDVRSNWLDWSYTSHFYRITGGDLAPGMDVTNHGKLVGKPLATGAYNFKVAVYGVDDSWWDWHDSWDSGTTDWLDSEWFTLFVTEASTNPTCPSPSTTGVTEVYICAGTVDEKLLATGDTFDLDLNYYIDPELSNNYLVNGVTFTINYDPASFEFDNNELTSNLMSDLPKLYEATATFDNSTPGVLAITLTTGNQDIHHSGRLMSLPVHVIADLPAQDFAFQVGGLKIDQNPKASAEPTLVGVDGSITVEHATTTPDVTASPDAAPASDTPPSS